MATPTPPPASAERGKQLHQHETRTQLILPFLLGIGVVLGAFLLVALPSEPIWRLRAQGIADWLYTLFCLLPQVACLFPIYLLVMASIYGMHRIHASAERPLRKLELLAEGLALRLESINQLVQHYAESLNSAIVPWMTRISTFESPTESNLEESPHEPRD